MLLRHRLTTLVLLGVLFTWTLGVNAADLQKINLDDAIEQALTKNSEILPAMLDLELAKIDLQKTEADQVLTPSPTQLRQKRLAVDKAEVTLQTLQNKVRREVTDQAFSILRAEDTVALNERKLAQSKSELATVQIKIELNMESNVTLLNTQKSLITAEKTLADSITSLEVARMNFLQYIGASDVTIPLKLEVSDFELKPETWDTKEATELALKQTTKVESARDQLEGAELDLKLNNAGFTTSTDRRKYEIAVEKARRVLEEEQKKAIIQVRQYLADLASLQKDLSAAEISVKVAIEQLAAAKVKAAQGMITEAQLQTQENTLTQSQQSLLDTKFRIRDKQQEIRDYLGL